jgi:DnaJ-class molecular chaperone
MSNKTFQIFTHNDLDGAVSLLCFFWSNPDAHIIFKEVNNLEIDSIEAMLGTEKTIQTIDGKEFSIKIPQACQYGQKFSLSGQGLYQMNTTHRGNLIVNVIIKTPLLSDPELTILRNIRNNS